MLHSSFINVQFTCYIVFCYFIFTTFLDYEADLLIKYYKKILQGEFIHETEKLRINSISKAEIKAGTGHYLITVNATYANEKYNCHLDEMIRILNLEPSKDALRRLNHSL
jgi:hypothetical protein